MPIKYCLHPNKLKGNKGSYYAQVKYTQVVDLEQIIEHILHRGSSLSKTDIIAVFDEMQAAFSYFLEEGYYVNTPLVKVYPSVSGTFDNVSDQYDKNRHELIPNVNPGKALVTAVKKASLKKVKPIRQNAELFQFVDHTTGIIDKGITPGGLVSIKGIDLKINLQDPDEGVFFKNSTGDTFKVDLFGKNTSGELIFMAPHSLIADEYTLEIIKVMKNHTRKQTSKFNQRLVVK